MRLAASSPSPSNTATVRPVVPPRGHVAPANRTPSTPDSARIPSAGAVQFRPESTVAGAVPRYVFGSSASRSGYAPAKRPSVVHALAGSKLATGVAAPQAATSSIAPMAATTAIGRRAAVRGDRRRDMGPAYREPPEGDGAGSDRASSLAGRWSREHPGSMVRAVPGRARPSPACCPDPRAIALRGPRPYVDAAFAR